MHKGGFDLERLAMHVMQESGLQPKFSDQVYIELSQMHAPAKKFEHCKDLRDLSWVSIDNDDSMDLDQLTYGQREKDGTATIWIAVADVSAIVSKDSSIDQHAQINTTSVYTPAVIFPMLPEKLSNDLTSLNENKDRLAVVVCASINQEGEIVGSSIFSAFVCNKAKLAYPSVGAWLAETGPIPEKIKHAPQIQQTVLFQHQIAQDLKNRRHFYGALTLESPEVEAKISGDQEVILNPPTHNFADQLIEQFMIVANHVMATQFRAAKIPSLRRVVRIPKRWDRIVAIAASFKMHLPADPDSKALEKFLIHRKKADPVAFPDLSLTIIKLLGKGEYIVETGEESPVGHFGLALEDYTHSTAPNRRFPDLITQRQCKALLDGKKSPYSFDELQMLSEHCSKQEDAAKKVERHLNKSAAALHLRSHIGTVFEGIVTGASERGTWARIFHPPVEGKILKGFKNLDVGDRVRVKLISVDIAKGHINFSTL